MIGIADFANAHKFGYRFRQMIGDHGAVEAAGEYQCQAVEDGAPQ